MAFTNAPETTIPFVSKMKDEEQRVISLSTLCEVEKKIESTSTKTADADVVRFELNDPENPWNWPASRKWPIVASTASMNMIAIYATTTTVPAAPQIIAAFNIKAAVYRTLLVSIWELGEGIGPFIYAPLAERLGRAPVYHTGNLLGIICSLACALSTNIAMFVVFWSLNGSVLTALTLSATIIGDMFRPEERGMALSIEGGLQLIATFIAPLCGAFEARALGWRWTIWIVVIAIGAFGGLSLIFVRETYEVKILERKAARLRRETGNTRLKSQHDTAAVEFSSMLGGVKRPMQKLIASPTVFLTALYGAWAYALSYLIVTTLTEVMEDNYNFTHGTVGLKFLAPAIGYSLGMAFYALTSDRYVAFMKKKDNGILKAKHRLVHTFLASIIQPLGFILYGWTLAFRVHFVVPLIGSALVGFSMMLSLIATSNYMVDAFGIYSASAVAASVILRAIFGATIPLAGPALYADLGLGWGNTLLAFLSMAFIPPLWFAVKHDKTGGPSS